MTAFFHHFPRNGLASGSPFVRRGGASTAGTLKIKSDLKCFKAIQTKKRKIQPELTQMSPPNRTRKMAARIRKKRIIRRSIIASRVPFRGDSVVASLRAGHAQSRPVTAIDGSARVQPVGFGAEKSDLIQVNPT